MNSWATQIESNHLYDCCAGELSPSESVAAGMSKVSLFTDQDDREQAKLFYSLVVSLAKTFQFRFCDAVQGGYWEVFALHGQLTAWVKQSVADSGFDYLVWPAEILKPPKLLLFDMDSTFIQIEVIDELAKRYGVADKVITVTESAMRGELDFAESLISRVACIKGLSVTVIEKIAANLPLSEGVEYLVDASHRNGAKVAIVSGGFSPFVERLKMNMNLFQVKANQLRVEAGLLTGEVEGPIVDAAAKADFLDWLCQSLEITSMEAMAIGDGANDLLMMQAAGFNLAYRAKPRVQAQARGIINQTNLGWLADILGWA